MVAMTIPSWLKPCTDPAPLKALSYKSEHPDKPVYIYGLYDQRDNRLRYIGKTIYLKDRLAAHCREEGKFHRAQWVRELRTLGLKPTMVVIEKIHGSWPWEEAEIFWIAWARGQGCDLTNATKGGEGVRGLTADGRRRISLAKRGIKQSPELIAKLSAIRKGRSLSPLAMERGRQARAAMAFTWGDKIASGVRKLGESDQKDVKGLLDFGYPPEFIAKLFGVCVVPIQLIAKGIYMQRRPVQKRYKKNANN